MPRGSSLLQIVPSKTNEERLLLVTPELASVLASLISRLRHRRDGSVPLVARYDNYEATTGPLLPHLFQRFYRATNVDARQISGLGIGLYVVREIVQLHGGDVRAASVEGEGSTFTVALPLEASHGAEQPAAGS